ncbi:MAG TPA: DegT/DnrJ/EryC1/StrS family aminotransferase [Candidatus Aminicenantes bacterium]|nr:DegT/DnrJ/EryC1/StrS family aminotransferase [Candidatus Aminicenantes bacterium]HRY65754.1 DegT/DnrJ/EryC1/StrS family aminotransferase [Candidatus Aminicenantes bacterium]HRZ72668.1 DegT/DnrJ/EryC1/StrS family aminotransferase [Candidatus Aminicenantes bacterium]
MNVPLLDLKAQYAAIREEIRPALDRVVESQFFILGPEVEALESEIAAYAGVRHAIGVSSGTDGLLVALMALGIKPGDEVVTTPFSFFATAGVIARLGAVPVFADIDPATFNIDPALLGRAITPRTRAILPVHLFGQCADMDPILAAARARGIPVVEDACQSIGAEYKGRKAGSLGDLGVFSFFPSKNLGGFGDGGMVVTNDPALSERIRLLRQHGSAKTYHHKLVGGNFRLDALQAAVLRVKLKHLDGWSAARRANAARYSELLAGTGLLDRSAVQVPVREKSGDPNHHIFNQYTLRARKRDGLQAFLKAAGIGTAVYYPVPLHLQECFAGLGNKAGDFPEAEKAAAEVLSLPVYPELAREQMDHVVRKIDEFYGERKA